MLDTTSYLLGKKAGGTTPTGTVDITSNGTTNVTNYAYADVNVQPDLESKSVTITENTTTTITPTQGKDGLSSVEVITNVPTGGFTPNFVSFSRYSGTNAQLASDISGVDFSSILGANYMFSNLGSSITEIDLSGVTTFPTSSKVYEYLCYQDSKLQRFTFCKDNKTHNATTLARAFNNCSKLTYCDLSTISGSPSIGYLFSGCSLLTFADLRNISFTMSTYTDAFSSVPSSCTIIVKNATEKTNFQNKFGTSWTNLKTVAEYEQ